MAVPSRTAGLAAFFAALFIGALAGVDPKLAIAAAFGIAFALVAVANLAVGVTIFTVLTFMELAPVAGGQALSFSKVAGLVLVISWIALVSSDRDQRLLFRDHPWLSGFLGFFLAWMTLSAVWAEDSGVISSIWQEDPGGSIGTIVRYALSIMLIPIVYTALGTRQKMRWIAAAFAGGAAFAAAYGLSAAPSSSAAAVSATAAGDLNRVTGTIGDPNLLASVLVVGIVMSATLALDQSRELLTRILGGVSMVLCFSAVVATASRGGLIATGAALLAWIVIAPKGTRPRVFAAVLAFAATVFLFFSVVASDEQVARITTADGGAGRTDIWKIGWRMFEANPVVGVGSGNFRTSSIHYLLAEPGAIQRSYYIADTPAVAHNLYLEILTELGLVGLTLFLAVIVGSMAAAVRAYRRFDRLGDAGMATIARATVIGLVATLAADFFLSAQFSKQLWILLSLGPALLAIARFRSPSGDDELSENDAAAALRP
ncbi:MAG: O-antigen ligase family protein [Solirubrobacterales bacterium]